MNHFEVCISFQITVKQFFPNKKISLHIYSEADEDGEREEDEKKETENPLIFFYRVCSRRIIRNYHRLNYFKCVEILKSFFAGRAMPRRT